MIFDPEGIHRAVLNVVTNAIDAVAETGARPAASRSAAEYLPEQNLVRIEVEDNGPGIPADQMEHLFSPFVSSKKSRGTGLGLPVEPEDFGGARRADRRGQRARPRLRVSRSSCRRSRPRRRRRWISDGGKPRRAGCHAHAGVGM